MWLKLSTFGLLPVLLIQGTKVRRNTPRLPEASGDREGKTGQGKPLSLLILGDSAAAGVGVENQQDALSGAIISELKTEYKLHWKLHAKTGDTTKQVYQAIQQLEPKKYDVVVTSVGVNDVTNIIFGIRSNQEVSLFHQFGETSKRVVFKPGDKGWFLTVNDKSIPISYPEILAINIMLEHALPLMHNWK